MRRSNLQTFQLLAAAAVGAGGMMMVGQAANVRASHAAMSALAVELAYNRSQLVDARDELPDDPFDFRTAAFQSVVSAQLRLPSHLNVRVYSLYGCLADIERSREYVASGRADKAGEEDDVLDDVDAHISSVISESVFLEQELHRYSSEGLVRSLASMRHADASRAAALDITLDPCDGVLDGAPEQAPEDDDAEPRRVAKNAARDTDTDRRA